MTSNLQPRQRWHPLGSMVVAGNLMLFGAFADAQEAGTSEPPVLDPKSAALDSLVFVPHCYDAPEVTETAGVRSAQEPSSGLPSVFVLAPPKLARTLSTQPTLYWYVSGPSSAPVRFTLQGLEEATPLLEVDLGPVPADGFYATSLAEHGVRLERGARYQWSVALEVNPEAYSEEPVAKTILEAIEADPALLAKIEGESARAQVEALAGAGYWYDAINVLSEQIAAGNNSQPWRELRAALLDQVGLEEAAAFEHAGGRAQ